MMLPRIATRSIGHGTDEKSGEYKLERAWPIVSYAIDPVICARPRVCKLTGTVPVKSRLPPCQFTGTVLSDLYRYLT